MNSTTYEVTVFEDRTEWHQNGQLHRIDGPAIEYADGDRFWYQRGKRHREDGPAVEYAEGDRFWYQNDNRHRIDGPAIEYADGDRFWHQNGQLHRTDGPAVELANGSQLWYQRGKRHREDGPAVEYADGSKCWYLNDRELTEAEHQQQTQLPKETTLAEIEQLLGQKHQVKVYNTELKVITLSERNRELVKQAFIQAEGHDQNPLSLRDVLIDDLGHVFEALIQLVDEKAYTDGYRDGYQYGHYLASKGH